MGPGTHSALTNSALHRESWFFAEIRRWLAANTTIRGLVMFSDLMLVAGLVSRMTKAGADKGTYHKPA